MRATDLTCDDVREMAGSFVLGALDPAEEAAVRAHLATCDDAHAEIAEAGSVLPGAARVRAGRRAVGGAEGADHGGRGRGPRGAVRRHRPPRRLPARHRRSRRRRPCPGAHPVPDRADRAERAAAQAAPRARKTSPVAWVLRIAAVVGDRRARRLEPAAPEPAQRRGAVPARRRGRAPARGAGRLDDRRAPARGGVRGGRARGDEPGRDADAGRPRPRSRPRATRSTRRGSSARTRSRSRSAASRWAATGPASWRRPASHPAAGIQVVLTLEPAPGATAPAGPVVSSGAASAVA